MKEVPSAAPGPLAGDDSRFSEKLLLSNLEPVPGRKLIKRDSVRAPSEYPLPQAPSRTMGDSPPPSSAATNCTRHHQGANSV